MSAASVPAPAGEAEGDELAECEHAIVAVAVATTTATARRKRRMAAESRSGEVHENRSSERPVVQSLRRIMLEIIIGFVGVYAAFALSAYKEHADAIDRRHQIKRALIREIIPLVEVSKHNTGDYLAFLTKFDSEVKAGAKPVPRPFVEPIALSMDVWEGTKQAGGLNLIDVPTFVRVSEFYNSWNRMIAYYSQVRDLSVNVILPNAGKLDAFYDAKTGALRPEFQLMYRADLRVLDRVSVTSAKIGADVIAILARDTI
jgi:hypothetical protein